MFESVPDDIYQRARAIAEPRFMTDWDLWMSPHIDAYGVRTHSRHPRPIWYEYIGAAIDQVNEGER